MISALPSELSEIGRRDALRAEAEQLFAEVDEDGSGTLDAEEVQQLASRLGLKLDRVAAKEAMDVMDADGGGDVDFEEFWMWWVENRDKKNPFMTLQEKADAARRERKGKLSSWLSGAGESGRDWHKTAHLMQQDLERIISAADVEGGGKDPAVYLAARWGHAEAVESLARLGVDVNETTEDGTTPLMVAAKHGRTACVSALLQSGRAAVDAADAEGATAMVWSAYYGHANCTKLLVEAGADTNLRWPTGPLPGKTALEWAEQLGHGKVVEIIKLLEKLRRAEWEAAHPDEVGKKGKKKKKKGRKKGQKKAETEPAE